MKWDIVVVGKPSLPWARDAMEDYLKRLRRMVSLEVTMLRPSPASTVEERMLEASEASWRIVLDERGRLMRSEELAHWIRKQELSGRKRVSVLIGGSDGHGEKVRAAANETWALSPMTLQHELALVVLLEQVYRAQSILRGEPYHRA